MENKLFIPSKIKVGYQNRSDTYTKKLAYVIYYDEKGKLRKETSWEGWRDKNIPSEEFENKPHAGFTLNKDVQRSSEWFGSGRNMIRVYDDRGIEFEIPCDNLIFILMTTDCLKRGLQGEFVYAWFGKELILLPTECEEYKTSLKFTELKSKKIPAKQLIPGCSYKTKNVEDLIYLGKFDFYTFGWDRSYNKKAEKVEKLFIFIDSNNRIYPLKNTSSLALQNSDVPVSNYAELMDVYNKSINSSPMKDLEFNKTEETFEFDSNSYYKSHKVYQQESDGSFTEIIIRTETQSTPIYREGGGIEKYTFSLKGYNLSKGRSIKFDNGLVINNINNHYHTEALCSKEELLQKNFVDLYYINSNNVKEPIKKII